MFTCYQLGFFVFKYAIWFENIMLIVVVIFSTQHVFAFMLQWHSSAWALIFFYGIQISHQLFDLPDQKYFYPFTTHSKQNHNTAAATFL